MKVLLAPDTFKRSLTAAQVIDCRRDRSRPSHRGRLRRHHHPWALDPERTVVCSKNRARLLRLRRSDAIRGTVGGRSVGSVACVGDWQRGGTMAEQVGVPPIDATDQLAAIGQAVITTDLDGVVIYWNAAAEELYGWTAAEAVGRNIATLTVPQVAQQVGADIMAALRDGVAWSGGFPVTRKDGTRFPALVTDSGIYRDGSLVGIIGVSTNLGIALRPLLERSTDAALVLNADAVITYASPAVTQLFGWTEGAVIGSSMIPLLHPDDRPTLGRFLEELLATPGAHPPVEVRVLSDHGWAWVEAARAYVILDEHPEEALQILLDCA